MIRIAARYHRLPIAVVVGLTCGVLVVAAGMMLRPVPSPVPDIAQIAPSPVGPPPSFAVIVPFTTPPPGVAAPSLPASASPPGRSADSTPPPSSAVATSAQPTVTAVPVTAVPVTPAPTFTLPPTVAPTFTATLPPITPGPTEPPITPAPTEPPVVTPQPTFLLDPTPPPAQTVSCGNGVDNSGGLGLICETTIIADALGATVTVRECHGAAGDPEAACAVRTTVGGPVESVTQCNGSANGGGAVARCSVHVSGWSGPAATVHQCVGSGATLGCDPFPATAPGADITQCDGSGNGGTLVGLTCVATGFGGIRVNQCNGSANGGGALLACSAIIQ